MQPRFIRHWGTIGFALAVGMTMATRANAGPSRTCAAEPESPFDGLRRALPKLIARPRVAEKRRVGKPRHATPVVAEVVDSTVEEVPDIAAVPIPGDEPSLEELEAAEPGKLVEPTPVVDQTESGPVASPVPPDAAVVKPADGSPSVALPRPTEPATAATTTVTGAVVLGLLPYTIPRGAFGLGTTVGMDEYSKVANVGFGPTASLGVTDWLTLGAAVPFTSAPIADERVTGLGNVGVNAQFAFYNDDASGIALSATPGVTLPSPSAAANTNVSPDLKGSGALNFGAIALNLTARGSVAVPTEPGSGDAVPGFDSALSLIMVDDTFAPFVEGALSIGDAVVPMAAAGLNWAPGGGALLTLGVPVAFYQDDVKPGMSFTAYFETDLFGSKRPVARATATSIAAAR